MTLFTQEGLKNNPRTVNPSRRLWLAMHELLHALYAKGKTLPDMSGVLHELDTCDKHDVTADATINDEVQDLFHL